MVSPNKAHQALVALEEQFQVTIITQNVDDLHERAGSSQVIHLHGELLKVRSTGDPSCILDWRKDLMIGDMCARGFQLRPHIVWFGEEVPLLSKAAEITSAAHKVIIIGTSMQVYPAASLVHFSPPGCPIYFVDPKPMISATDMDDLVDIPDRADVGVPSLVASLTDKAG
jgi:NAD-dependent deacetylase